MILPFKTRLKRVFSHSKAAMSHCNIRFLSKNSAFTVETNQSNKMLLLATNFGNTCVLQYCFLGQQNFSLFRKERLNKKQTYLCVYCQNDRTGK